MVPEIHTVPEYCGDFGTDRRGSLWDDSAVHIGPELVGINRRDGNIGSPKSGLQILVAKVHAPEIDGALPLQTFFLRDYKPLYMTMPHSTYVSHIALEAFGIGDRSGLHAGVGR